MVYVYPVYIPSSEMGVSLSQYFVVVCIHTPLELYTYTWYLVRSDGVKFGVPGLQTVNGQSNEVFDLRLCPIYQCWTYHFETSHKIMRS